MAGKSGVGHKKVKLYIFTQMSEQFWPQAQIDEKAENGFVQIRFFFSSLFKRNLAQTCSGYCFFNGTELTYFKEIANKRYYWEKFFPLFHF